MPKYRIDNVHAGNLRDPKMRRLLPLYDIIPIVKNGSLLVTNWISENLTANKHPIVHLFYLKVAAKLEIVS